MFGRKHDPEHTLYAFLRLQDPNLAFFVPKGSLQEVPKVLEKTLYDDVKRGHPELHRSWFRLTFHRNGSGMVVAMTDVATIEENHTGHGYYNDEG